MVYRKNLSNRRDFIKKSAFAAMAVSLAYPSFLSGSPQMEKVLKVGLIGCGGRGTGAAAQALKADPNVVITVLGDIFDDKLQESLHSLTQIDSERVKVPKASQITGFDAYKKVIDSDIDVVLLATPPAFRPLHFEYAAQQGKHIFSEKPVAVDAPGIRRITEAAKIAKQKNLNIVSGFCFRYDNSMRAIYDKVLKGDIGHINSVTTFRNEGEAWFFPREESWSDMENYLRNWYYYKSLSGDFIVEQAVHSIDLMSWAMKDEMPVRAIGTGGRQVRVDKKYGNIYDHFAVEFEYANGEKGYHFARQQAGTTPRNSVDMLGDEGAALINVRGKYEIKGKENWKYSGPKNNMYQTQHDELFAAIRSGNVLDDSKHMINSTLLAILARDVSYSGKTITVDEMLSSKNSLGAEIDSYDWNMKWEPHSIAIPGVTKVI